MISMFGRSAPDLSFIINQTIIFYTRLTLVLIFLDWVRLSFFKKHSF